VLVPEGFSIQQRLASVLDELDETVFLVDVEPGPSLRFVTLTGRHVRLPNGKRADVHGMLVEDVFTPESAELAYHWWVKALELGTTQHYQAEVHFPQIGPRVVDVTVFPWNGGEQLAGIIRDVTTEVEALHHVRERDELNRAVLDATPTATAVLDEKGTIKMVNAAWVVDAADLELDVALPGDQFVTSMAHVPGAAMATQLVLDGDRAAFHTDYLDRGRWFSLRVTPFEIDGGRGAIVTRSDVTARVNEQHAIQQLHERWQAAFNSASIGMALVNQEGRFVLVNPWLCELFGRTEEEMLEVTAADVTPADDQSLVHHIRRLPSTTTGMEGSEKRYLRSDGSTIWTWVNWSTVHDEGIGDTYFMQFQDIGPRKRAEARLADHQAVLELVASGADLETVLRKVADVGEAHLPGSHWVVMATGSMGWSEHVTAVGLDKAHALELDEAYRTFAPTRWRESPGVIVIPPDGGTPVGAALRLGGAWTLPVVEDGGHVAGFVVVHDPPEQADAEDFALVEQLGSVVRILLQRDAATRRLAERMLEDSLTGLPSRTLFHRRAEQAIARIGHGSRGVAVLCLDLDRFGRINESLGHLAGDEVLAEVARRLRGAVPSPDTVARGGGDEFLVLVEDVADADAAMATAEHLLTELRRPLLLDDIEFTCPASIGVVFRSAEGSAIETLEGDASLAMATAKARGRDRAQLFTDQLRSAMPRLSLERELQLAVTEQQFVVRFQPEVELATNRIVGVEALVRWEHPERGLLPPADFVGAAEESGVIVDIGRQVLEESCARLAEWSAHADHTLTVAVNLSARQLADPGLVEFTRSTLERHGIEPSRLVLEMTESTLVDDAERASTVFGALRDLGVSIAIDDFGTGYSSLLYLKRFPADVLKIDRSFVDGLGADAGDSAIVAAVVRLAHRLDLTVIAEGVETPEQLAHLKRLGCEQGQGYLWSRPMTADDMTALLQGQLADIPIVSVGPLEPGDDRSELDELLAVLTHELSTPLTVIGGYAEMLADRLDLDEVDAGARTGVAAIERNVHNLGRLVAALADARGLGSGGDSVTFDVRPFVEQTMADLAPILTAHDLDVHVGEGPDAVVTADPVGLSQILTNLVGNATKFSDPGDRIEVAVDTEGDPATVAVTVVDHGTGVPAERVDELFGRFARLGSTRRGLGLGLYLSRSIARRHGGDVVHRPTPGGGATFVLTLPASTEEL
jgi:diguanylate cyclase (GGDEF)-like protein/PAS domain S-box-containing protein